MHPCRMQTRPLPSLPNSIDPRSPRFGAGITAVLLLVAIALSLADRSTGTLGQQAITPGFILFVAISALFAWGAGAGVQRHPYGALFRVLVRPRLDPPREFEDAAAPTFAQGVGFAITLAGIILELAGVPFALVVAAILLAAGSLWMMAVVKVKF